MISITIVLNISGHLAVEIVPCTKDFLPVGEDDFVEDPKELVMIIDWGSSYPARNFQNLPGAV